jgi:hypothetical protein
MKVFISHASADKRIARRIADELHAIGVDTFLDENNLSTGDDFEHTIQRELARCDDFLVLLTKRSIGREWVLIELGGALALRKRIVPILHLIEPEQIPGAIGKNLARRLSDIGRYYDELRERPPQSARSARRRRYAVGQRVRIVGGNGEAVRDNARDINWLSPEMDAFKGRQAVVREIDEADRTVRLDVDGMRYWWAVEWLMPAARI